MPLFIPHTSIVCLVFERNIAFAVVDESCTETTPH